jgi:hypothetical protein
MMNNPINKQRIKIIASIIGSLGLAYVLSAFVFLPNNPRLKPIFIDQIANLPQTIASLPNKFKPTINNVPLDENTQKEYAQRGKLYDSLKDKFQPVAKGVYAAEDPASKTTVVKINDDLTLEKKQVTRADGTTITIYAPVK